MAVSIHEWPEPDESHELVRTETGAKLHIAPCPHILGAGVRQASAAERLAMQVCTWCEAELAGVGRTYFDNLEDAMRFFGAHVGTDVLIRDALRNVMWDQIWVPNSKSYIALGREGMGVAWVGKTYVVPARGAFVELPGYEAGSGGGSPSQAARGDTCPRCNLERPVAGTCDNCD